MTEPEGGRIVRRLLLVNRRAPHGTIYAQESLEVVLAAAAFEQEVSLAFLDDGVYQLMKGQDTGATGNKDFSRTFRALEHYDMDRLFVDRESLAERALGEDDLLVPVAVLDQPAMAELMDAQDVILSFCAARGDLDGVRTSPRRSGFSRELPSRACSLLQGRRPQSGARCPRRVGATRS